ncbi:MAG: hypothetical protein R3B84_11560 [Zavarzinella sp.]
MGKVVACLFLLSIFTVPCMAYPWPSGPVQFYPVYYPNPYCASYPPVILWVPYYVPGATGSPPSPSAGGYQVSPTQNAGGNQQSPDFRSGAKLEPPVLPNPKTELRPDKKIVLQQYPVTGNRRVVASAEVKVGFFNHSTTELDLLINGEKVALPSQQYVTMKLPRTFEWQQRGKEVKKITVPDDAVGIELVFRDEEEMEE